MTSVSVPQDLVDQLMSGRVVLFLGSRAIPAPERPTDRDIANVIASRCLEDSFRERPLAELIQLAESETDLATVDAIIADIYGKIEPIAAEFMITRFFWAALATTRIDLALERAYDRSEDALQRCIPFLSYQESIDELMSAPESVMYLKLHGSVSKINNPRLPLIVSPDQYITHQGGRATLHERLELMGDEHTFLFAGNSLGDSDLRMMLIRHSNSQVSRPRSYVAVPSYSAAEYKLWDNKKVTCIGMSIADLLAELDKSIPLQKRKLTKYIARQEHRITQRFVVNRPMTERLISFLENSVEYISKGHQSGPCHPLDFYRGHFEDWAPIEHGLDVQRALTETLLSEVILADENASELQRLFLVKGHAGSGKTVILRRLAWDAAKVFDKICLYARDISGLSYEPLEELHSLCNDRIFIFIDNITGRIGEIESVVSGARKRKIPLTILAAARYHTWNALGNRLASLVTQSYEVRYLNEKEIDALIDLLTLHKSSGYLAGLPREQQHEALSKKAGRQLLVALHEATLGKPFSDIVLDEYESIAFPAAKSLYLTVCVLHRLGIKTRAGVISRVHQVPFRVFREELFSPLESIVFAREDKTIRDFVYESRHPHIAEIVFERVLTNAQARYEEYVRILNVLDIGYKADSDAFWGLLNARELIRLFPDPEMSRSLYEIALGRYPDEPALLQQYAVFEMHLGNGRLDFAGKLLRQARLLSPSNQALSHSYAELMLRRASRANHAAERARLRSEARKILRTMTGTSIGASYTFHSLLKIELDELDEVLSEINDDDLQRKITEVERLLAEGLQRAPDDQYILDAEAKFARLLKNTARAFVALQRAFASNKGSSYLALRLAKMCREQGKGEEAINVLKDCLEARPGDKDVHYELAKQIANVYDDNNAEVLYHLRRSFTRGDTRYEAQFWYARAEYISGNYEMSNNIFRDLRNVDVDARNRVRPRGLITSNGDPAEYSGVLMGIETSYAYVKRDRTGDQVFIRASDEHHVAWTSLRSGMRVIFKLAFNYRGPIAVGLRPEGRVSKKVQPPEQRHQETPVWENASVDIGIVVALAEEFRELKSRIGTHQVVEDVDLGHHYYTFRYPPEEDGYNCVATLIGEMGQEKALLAAERFISRWNPDLLINLGIAGSLHHDVMVGDVVVGSQVGLILESGKVGGRLDAFDVESAGSAYRAPRELVDRLRNLEFSYSQVYVDWIEQCRRNAEESMSKESMERLLAESLLRERPTLQDVHIATGPVVAANPDFVRWVRATNRAYKVIDMESGGLMIAAVERVVSTKTLVLRGISDYSDDRKAELERMTNSGARKYAMLNATDLLLALMNAALLERSGK